MREGRSAMEGNIVKVVKSGETTFVFHDTYCRKKTLEETRQILARVAAITLPGLKAAIYQKERDNTNSA